MRSRWTHALAFVLGILLTILSYETVRLVRATSHALQIATASAHELNRGEKAHKRKKRVTKKRAAKKGKKGKGKGKKGARGGGRSKRKAARERMVERFRDMPPEQQDEIIGRLNERLLYGEGGAPEAEDASGDHALPEPVSAQPPPNP